MRTFYLTCAIMYAFGVMFAPFFLSLFGKDPYCEENMRIGDVIGVWITVLLWPAGLLMWTMWIWWTRLSQLGFEMAEKITELLGGEDAP